MNIMIDYDNTYTADPGMWRKILPMMQLRNHNIYLVTSRGSDTPVDLEQDFVSLGIPIIYCNYRAKKEICEQLGVKIDIWIDDDPYYIVNGFLPHEAYHVQDGPGDSHLLWNFPRHPSE